MPRPDTPFASPQTTAKPRLLDQVRDVLRRKQYDTMYTARKVSPILSPLNWNMKSYFLPISAAPQTLYRRPAANP